MPDSRDMGLGAIPNPTTFQIKNKTVNASMVLLTSIL
jgi:hypothetical protein